MIEAHQDELARSVTREMGKTLPDARAEVGRAIEMIEAASAVPQTMQGRILENVATAVDCETIRQPVGVCAAIVPFNFPAMVPFWFLPFAIACGNTFILKPSEQVPLTQELVFNLIDDAGGLPDGVVNLVNGSVDVVNGILDHPGIDAISFVGSAKVAKYVYERAGRRRQARPGAGRREELHGRDARRGHGPDRLEHPGQRVRRRRPALHGRLGGRRGRRRQGGRCSSCSKARTEALAVGDGLADGTDVGPVVSTTSRDRILELDRPRAWRRARRWSSTAARPGADPDGAFVGPTILDDVTPDMEIAQEEIFGPVLSVIHADSLDEAIDIVNASRYGNGTSIFTESGAAVRRYRHDVEVGMIGVNVGVAAPVAFFPFSGLEGLVLRRPARARRGRRRVLHAQEDDHDALVLGRRDRPLLRRAGRALDGVSSRRRGSSGSFP